MKIETAAQLESALDERRNLVVDGDLEITIDVPYSANVGYIRARDIRSSDIIARDIIARDIIASDIRASVISARVIKTSSIYAVAFAESLKCIGIYPLSGPNDRRQWADRFGIDTSSGCYEEWHERLAEVAKRLLRKKCWLPIERQMLLSVTGYYKDGVTAEEQFK